MIGTFSKGILKRRLLPIALEADLVACKQGSRADRLSGVLGWGLKDNTKKAKTFAHLHDLPYFSLEDGFIRSVGLGVTGSFDRGFFADLLANRSDVIRTGRASSMNNLKDRRVTA